MKIDHNVAAVLLLGLSAGMLAGPEIRVRPELDEPLDPRKYRIDRYRMPRGIASGNRLHAERAPRGSAEEADRLAAAAAKRARKAARGARS